MNKALIIATSVLVLGVIVKNSKSNLVDLTKPRGVRANNPLNIEQNRSNNWLGKVTPSVDKRFETFSAPKYGFRAGARTLRTYQNKHGLNSIRELIHRFAPSNENKSDNYAEFVAGQVGVLPDAQVNLSDNALLASIVYAMSVMEVGRGWYTLDDARQGVALA